jgi:hypothetical protein
MVTPDSLISKFGEGIALTRTVEFDTGRDGVTNVTREIETTAGVVSSPSESAEQRTEGRIEDGMITVTVPSGTDVRADRDGGRDRLLRPAPDVSSGEVSLWVQAGETYTVSSGETETYRSVRLDGELSLEGEILLEDGDITIGDGVRAYTIEDVSRDRHPIAGVDKLTLTCSEYGGRDDLQNDASEYVSA